MRCLVIHENIENIEPVLYTLNLLFSYLDCDYKIAGNADLLAEIQSYAPNLLFYYGYSMPSGINLPYIFCQASNFWDKHFLTKNSLPKSPMKYLKDIPVLFLGGNFDQAGHRKTRLAVTTNADLIASTFFLASRYEEVVNDTRDDCDRFPAEGSYAVQENFIDRPVINEYLQLITCWATALGLKLTVRNFWQPHNFAVALTHDIDLLTGWREAIFYCIKNMTLRTRSFYLKRIVKILIDKLIHKDPYQNVKDILNLEKIYDVNSSFYFLIKGKHKFDGKYRHDSRLLKKYYRDIIVAGSEIGLHGSFNSMIKEQLLQDEKKKLEAIAGVQVIGGRQHFLRFNVLASWRKQLQANFSYDSSLGFSTISGYRAGFAFPFYPYDFNNKTHYEILEFPLILMDSTLRIHEKIPQPKLNDRILHFLQITQKHQGLLTVCWHNTAFAGDKFKGFAEAYHNMLDWIKKNNGTAGAIKKIMAQFMRSYRSGL